MTYDADLALQLCFRAARLEQSLADDPDLADADEQTASLFREWADLLARRGG